MLLNSELQCPQCSKNYFSAALLLKHFSKHVNENSTNFLKASKKNIPDLYPIKIDPIKYCEATLNEDTRTNLNNARKYQCSYCKKQFGWSTDLKRHILTHTGEKPFQCIACLQSFTRKFLLKNHEIKCKKYKSKTKIPDLKPIVLFKNKVPAKSKFLSNKKSKINQSFEFKGVSICST